MNLGRMQLAEMFPGNAQRRLYDRVRMDVIALYKASLEETVVED
jgi:hypothetical protein